MINCEGEGLSFKQEFTHVAAHQDKGKDYGELSRESQLNCQDCQVWSSTQSTPSWENQTRSAFPWNSMYLPLKGQTNIGQRGLPQILGT